MADKTPLPENDVDMDRIEAMMGPAPSEDEMTPLKKGKKEDKKDKSSKKDAKASDTATDKDGDGIRDSLQEFNESLKAKMPGLGEASIEKVSDEEAAALGEVATAPEVAGAAAVSEPAAEATAAPAAEPDPASVAEAKKALDPTVAPTPKEDVPAEKEDPSLDRAVDDIVSDEADEVLAAEDQKKADTKTKKAEGLTLKDRIYDLLHHPKTKWILLAIAGVLVLAAVLLPFSRYFILNTAGVRVKSSVTVVDQSTTQPLKNVKVTFGNKTALTGSDGRATVTGVKQGPQTMTVEKTAFATVTKNVTLGWGSNPQGDVQLTPTGNQYTFMITDYLSGKPIEKVEATSGDGDATSDKDGKLVLTLDTTSDNDVDVTLSAEGLRTETVTLKAGTKETQNVKMVPSRKYVYISKKSGKYDVYKVDADGKNASVLVNGTGLERQDIALVNHPTEALTALVATRENVRNSDGFLLSTLYTIDVTNGKLTKVDQSERIQIIGWTSEQRLVYVKVAAGASAANPKRQRLMSYNAKAAGDNKELASANSFNDVLMVNEKIYYAPSGAYQAAGTAGLFRIGADGTVKTSIFNQETWNILRTDYDTLTFAVGSDWYTTKISADTASKAASAPTKIASRLYVNSPEKQKSLWVDSRDGKGVLLDYNVSSKKEDTVATKAGLKNPVSWLTNNYIVFRVSDGKETADYAVSLQGGEAKKIIDVTDVPGVDAWYNY